MQPGPSALAPGRTREGVAPVLLAPWMALVVGITSLPYLLLWLAAGRWSEAGSVYSWILPPYPEDGLAYLAWIKQAAGGALLFHVKFTQIEHSAVLFHPVFLVTGWLAALTGWDAGQALFAVRALAVAAFLWTLARFSRVFALSNRERWLFLWLAVCSSGLGAIVGEEPLRPADLWIPDLNTLWSLVWNPILAIALTLLLWIFVRVAEADERRAGRAYLAAGALTGVLAFVHAYDVISAVVVVLVWTLLRRGRRGLRPLLLYGLAAAPAGLLQAAISLTHPILSAHGQSAAMPSPSPLSYAAGLGLPGLLAVYAAARTGRSGRLRELDLAWIWIAAAFALAYAPVWFQRKLVMGVHLPVCLLAAVGLADLAERWSGGRRGVHAALIAAVLLASMPSHFWNARQLVAAVAWDPTAYYRAPAFERALRWLDREVDPGAVVLAHLSGARSVPGASGQFVSQGHWAQSVDFEEHRRWIATLFDPRSPLAPAAKQRALRESRIDYVLIDPLLRRDWQLESLPEWLVRSGEVVYDESGITILRVDHPGGRGPARRRSVAPG